MNSKFANKGLEEDFIKYYSEHKDISVAECSKIIGVSDTTGFYYLKKNNIVQYSILEKQKKEKKIVECAKYYSENIGISIQKCAEKFGLKRHHLSNYLKNNNIKKHDKVLATINDKQYVISQKGSHGRKKYWLDDMFFDVIDTEEKAYWLGFFLADASVSNKGNKISIGLSIKDYDHLHRLKKSLNMTHPIIEFISSNGYESCMISFFSQNIKEKLISYNVIPNKKEHGKHPYLLLNNDLIKHYIRGFFDGDGCVSEVTRKENGNKRYVVEIASCKEMLTFIKKFLADNNIEVSDIREHMSIYGIRTSNNLEIIKFFNLIYKDANIYLPRKYERLENVSRVYSISDEE